MWWGEDVAERVIRKYANRKFYDLGSRSYVSLKTIAQLVRDGVEIQVVDQVDGSDITDAVLEQLGQRTVLTDSFGLVKAPAEQVAQMLRVSLQMSRDLSHKFAGSLNFPTTEDVVALRKDVRAMREDLTDVRKSIEELREMLSDRDLRPRLRDRAS